MNKACVELIATESNCINVRLYTSEIYQENEVMEPIDEIAEIVAYVACKIKDNPRLLGDIKAWKDNDPEFKKRYGYNE